MTITTVHCVDVSGSMSNDQLEKSQREVMKRFKPCDIVVLFDIRVYPVSDLERKFTSYHYPVIGRGGTDPTEAIEFAKKQNAKAIVYTDGFILDSDMDMLNETATEVVILR